MNPCPPSDRRQAAGRRALPVVFAALLSACATLAPPADLASTHSLVPAAWSTRAATPTPGPPTALAGWWQRFDDPALSTLVTQALQANTSIKSAQAALRQARALADVQSASLGPALSVSTSAQRSRSGNNDASNSFKAGLSASWEADLFGGNRAAANASATDAQASAASLSSVQVSLAAEVASSYINLRGLQARLAIARSNLATQTETLQITRWRAQAGLVSSLDVELAVSAAEQTQAQVPALQTSVAQALNALAVLTGQAPGTLNGTLAAAPPWALPARAIQSEKNPLTIDNEARDTAADTYASSTRTSRAAAKPLRTVARNPRRSLSSREPLRARPKATNNNGIRHNAATVQ